jgi:hypothetical protein
MTKIFGTLIKVLKCPRDKLLRSIYLSEKYLGTNYSYMESKAICRLYSMVRDRVGVV